MAPTKTCITMENGGMIKGKERVTKSDMVIWQRESSLILRHSSS